MDIDCRHSDRASTYLDQCNVEEGRRSKAQALGKKRLVMNRMVAVLENTINMMLVASLTGECGDCWVVDATYKENVQRYGGRHSESYRIYCVGYQKLIFNTIRYFHVAEKKSISVNNPFSSVTYTCLLKNPCKSKDMLYFCKNN